MYMTCTVIEVVCALQESTCTVVAYVWMYNSIAKKTWGKERKWTGCCPRTSFQHTLLCVGVIFAGSGCLKDVSSPAAPSLTAHLHLIRCRFSSDQEGWYACISITGLRAELEAGCGEEGALKASLMLVEAISDAVSPLFHHLHNGATVFTFDW